MILRTQNLKKTILTKREKNLKSFPDHRAEEERLEMARALLPEQMMVLQEIIKFCKKLTIPDTSIVKTNSQIWLIVHGGTGTGKSRTIKACAQWAEKLL